MLAAVWFRRELMRCNQSQGKSVKFCTDGQACKRLQGAEDSGKQGVRLYIGMLDTLIAARFGAL